MNKETKKKIEIAVIVVIVLVSFIAIMYMIGIQNMKSTNVVAVYKGAETILEFDPSEDATYDVTGEYGEMTITVKDGSWCVSEVECPNHICEQMGWKDTDSIDYITCIPNNIVIICKERS